MGNKTSKKKSYTEDVVLNKILKDISDENLENATSSSQEHPKQNTYEDDLIKHYRKKDALELRQKYINIAKIIAVLFVMVGLILIITNDNDTPPTKETQVKKTVTPTSVSQAKVVKASKPVEVKPAVVKPAVVKPVKIEQKEIIPVKREAKEVIPAPITEPVKKVKTERELAKEMLLRQMNN